MYWVSEQGLLDQVNTICRNKWMTELKMEELERKVTRNNSSLKNITSFLTNPFISG